MDLEKRFPHQLSGGEARRVSLARAMAPQPRYLLLDEPLAHLDQALKEKLFTQIQVAVLQCVNLIYVTHDPREAVLLDGRCLHLETV